MAQSNGMGVEQPTTGDYPTGTHEQMRAARLARETKRASQAPGLSTKDGGKDGMYPINI